MRQWQLLESEDQLSALQQASFLRPQLIFKHSTRCGISFQVKDLLSSATDSLSDSVDLHYLDLIAFRSLSNHTADELGVPHQSPQVILLREGKVVYHSSHFAIDPKAILAAKG
jgi:bacillithiol system protein YtxJ